MTDEVIWLILGLPLLAFLLVAFGVRRSPLLSGWLVIMAIAGSFVLSIATFTAIATGVREIGVVFSWAPVADGTASGIRGSAFGLINLPFRVDGLTAVMLVVVTSVSLLVQIYSLGYMHG